MLPTTSRLVNVCLVAFVFLATGALQHSIVNADETQNEAQLISELDACQSKREQLYENGHFVWQVTEDMSGKTTKQHYEYWANSGEYFRLDSYALKDGKPEGEIDRLISTPSATTLVIASGLAEPGRIATSSSLDICKDGACPPSLSSIRGQFFVAHANRYATLQVNHLLKLWQHKEYDLTDLQFAQNDLNACVITFTREQPEGTKKHSVTMEPKTYRVQSWTYEFFGKDNQRHAVQQSVLIYDSSNPEIPSEEHSVASNNSRPILRSSTRLIEFDLKPAKLELFVLPLAEM